MKKLPFVILLNLFGLFLLPAVTFAFNPGDEYGILAYLIIIIGGPILLIILLIIWLICFLKTGFKKSTGIMAWIVWTIGAIIGGFIVLGVLTSQKLMTPLVAPIIANAHLAVIILLTILLMTWLICLRKMGLKKSLKAIGWVVWWIIGIFILTMLVNNAVSIMGV